MHLGQDPWEVTEVEIRTLRGCSVGPSLNGQFSETIVGSSTPGPPNLVLGPRPETRVCSPSPHVDRGMSGPCRLGRTRLRDRRLAKDHLVSSFVKIRRYGSSVPHPLSSPSISSYRRRRDKGKGRKLQWKTRGPSSFPLKEV